MSTATLQIEKKKTVVPQLRFQEFDKEWELNKLGDITSWASGGTPPKDNPLFWEGDIPWISASSMRGIVYSNSELKITSAGLKKGSKLAKKGSLLILVRGSMLFNKIPIGIVSKDVAFNQDVKSIVVSDSSTSEFILNWFTAFEPKILNMVTGTGIGAGKLDLPDLKALKISIPTLPEQQKIASFLSAVDEKIQQLSRKKELLEQYKKGVMQQLFSGKLRFKDENGNDYADWEEKKTKDFVLDKKGAMKIGPFGSQLKKTTFVSEGFKVYGQENIFIADFDFGDRYITEAHFNTLKTNELHPGDFVISTMGTIGKCCLVPSSIKRGVMDSHMIRLQLNQTKILPKLLGQVFISYLVQKQVKRFSVGGIMDGLSMGIINKLKFTIPVNIEEQQKVADFLSSIDTKIESTNQQITQTQSFKKGLLQQMFV